MLVKKQKKIMVALPVFLLIVYGFGVFVLLMALFAGASAKQNFSDKTTALPKVSIVVPFRNEAKTITALLSDFLQIDYPSHLLEIYLVDDHSTDASVKVIRAFWQQHATAFPMEILPLPEGKNGKKQAQIEGVARASGHYVLFTDADCRIPPSWVRSMVASVDNDTKLVLGEVELTGKSILQRLQTLEYRALMQITHATVVLGNPFLANGANLLVEKKAFEKAAHDLKLSLASGDDVFLLQAIRHHYGAAAIRFQAASKALVQTEAMPTWHLLLQQRGRWVSKISHMANGLWWGIVLQVGTLAWIVALATPAGRAVWWNIFVAKTLLDAVFLLPMSVKRQNISLLAWLPLLELVYPFYQLAVWWKAWQGQPIWKGRTLKMK